MLVLKQKNTKLQWVAPSFFDLYECSECNTTYPKIDGHIMYNGEVIEDCPFCNPNKNSKGA